MGETAGQPVDKAWVSGVQANRPKKSRWASWPAAWYGVKVSEQPTPTPCDQVDSPYTVTVISTNTSVCNETPTLVSPTTLIGPLGRRTWDLATL